MHKHADIDEIYTYGLIDTDVDMEIQVEMKM